MFHILEAMIMSHTKQFLNNDKFAQHAGIELLEVKSGTAKVRMEVKPFHINGVGLVHGGALFTLADFAFAAAANSHEEVAVAINASISYLKGVKAGILYAEAEEISNSRKISVYSIKIINEHNQLIATFQGMAYKKVQR
jgi:acyl-CoA thioesterase